MPPDELRERLIRIEDQTAAIQSLVSELKEALWGQHGIVNIVQDNNSFVKNRRWLEKVIVVALTGSMVTGAIAAVVYLVKVIH